MRPYKCVPVFDYSSLYGVNGVTKLAAQGTKVYLGTQAGVLLLVNVCPSLPLEELIHSGRIARAAQIFCSVTGKPAVGDAWRSETTAEALAASSPAAASEHGAIVNIAVGPSLGLAHDELLCLSQSGYLVLVKSHLQAPPIVVTQNALAFAQPVYWDEQLDVPRTVVSFGIPASDCQNGSGNVVAAQNGIGNGLGGQRALLCVCKKKKLVFFAREVAEEHELRPFVVDQEIVLPGTPLKLLWVDRTIGLVFPDDYQVYRMAPEKPSADPRCISLLPEAPSKLPNDSAYSNMILTDTNEFLLLTHGTLGIFVNFLTLQLSSKSTIAWRSPLTALEPTGPFIIGATVDDDLLIFTSKTPVVLCQTIPTQGRVVDMVVCYDNRDDRLSGQSTGTATQPHSNRFCAKPVIIATTDALWYLSPVPFMSQFKKLVLEFNIAEALQLVGVHTPTHSVHRHRELGTFHEVFGWRYFQQLDFPMAFLHFRFSRDMKNVVARLLEYWGLWIGLPAENGSRPGQDDSGPGLSRPRKATALWRDVLYRWLTGRQDAAVVSAAEQPEDDDSVFDHATPAALATLIADVLAPSPPRIDDMLSVGSDSSSVPLSTTSTLSRLHRDQSLARTDPSDNVPFPKSTNDGHIPARLREASWGLIDFLLLSRTALLHALLRKVFTRRASKGAGVDPVSSHRLVSPRRPDAAEPFPQTLIRLWNDHAVALHMPVLSGLPQSDKGTRDDENVREAELGFFIRMVDAAVLSVIQHLHSPRSEKEKSIYQRVRALLIPPTASKSFWASAFSADTMYLTPQGISVVDRVSGWAAEGLPCFRSWVSNFASSDLASASAACPSLCLPEDVWMDHPLYPKKAVESPWSPFLYNRHLRFQDALDIWVDQQAIQPAPSCASTSDSWPEEAVLAGVASLANMVCGCHACHSAPGFLMSHEKTPMLLLHYAPLLYRILKDQHDRIAFLLLMTVGIRIPDYPPFEPLDVAHTTRHCSAGAAQSSWNTAPPAACTEVKRVSTHRADDGISNAAGDLPPCTGPSATPRLIRCRCQETPQGPFIQDASVSGVHMDPNAVSLLPFAVAVELIENGFTSDPVTAFSSAQQETNSGSSQQASRKASIDTTDWAKVLYLQLAWAAYDELHTSPLPSGLVTDMLKEGLRYAHLTKQRIPTSTIAQDMSSVVVSRLFLLRVLELEPSVYVSSLLDFMDGLADGLDPQDDHHTSFFRPERSLCYTRLGHLKNALGALLDPTDIKSFTACEAFCHAVNAGAVAFVGDALPETQGPSRSVAVKKKRRYPATDSRSTPACLFTYFFDNDPSLKRPAFWRVQAEFWQTSKDSARALNSIPGSRRNEDYQTASSEFPDFTGYDVLLGLSLPKNPDHDPERVDASDDHETSVPPSSHRMIFQLLEVLIDRWHHYQTSDTASPSETETATAAVTAELPQGERPGLPATEPLGPVLPRQTAAEQTHHAHFYKCCALTLLHKYATHPDLDILDVLQLIPDAWSLESLMPYLTHGLRHFASMEHQETFRESLARSSFLQCSCEWATASSQYVTVTRESTCPICSKRLAIYDGTAFGTPTTSVSSGKSGPTFSLLAFDPKNNRCGHLHCLQKSA